MQLVWSSGLVYQWATEVLSPIPIEVHWIRNGVPLPDGSKFKVGQMCFGLDLWGDWSQTSKAFRSNSCLDALRAANERISLTVAGEKAFGEALLQELTQFYGVP